MQTGCSQLRLNDAELAKVPDEPLDPVSSYFVSEFSFFRFPSFFAS
jgi:hypothetical protein